MVYSDVIKKNLILEKKDKYTKADFNKLIKKGFEPKTARFICLCSFAYHDTNFSKWFNSIDCHYICDML